ncbi:ABC transporter permease [Undibacterium sp.]|jgi:putative ABC transport system permease protein|uniref:ABC transporter permease n=1 Tax=Undibacterium sp. TaxID=1914977 RepID=UPI002C45EC1E|nr:ABC transporter permease [Undibacterium sp.]HTD03673.1 ABC transporter permease [Undibacterium sp.]
MFKYYFMLGVRSLRRNPALTALMVLTLAVGVAASVSTLTILQVMSGNPIPHKSDRLLVPLLDNGSLKGYVPGAKPDDIQMTYRDAANLLASKQGPRRTVVYGIEGGIEPERADLPVVEVSGLAVSSDYFAMFETPFLYGGAWSEKEDGNKAGVIVLSRLQSEKMYGKANPVGKHVRLHSNDFQIVGVLDTWNPIPRYTHLLNGNGGSFNGEDGIFIPFSTAIRIEFGQSGSTTCNDHVTPGYQGFLDSECTWLQFWFESKSASDRVAIQNYLNAYAGEQRKLGRFPRNSENKLYNVTEWLDYLGVVRSDSKLSVWLSFGFLLLCLVNTVGLLLAKFSVRASEVGVRRALGASRAEIFKQFLIETAVVGLAGGLLGLPLSFLGMRIIADQSANLSVVPGMDWMMLGITFLLSVSASILAGLLPTWRACQVTPALQLKSQ